MHSDVSIRPTGAPVRFPDRYQDVQLVATGGMGQVYCAKDVALGRVVAIKLLDDRFATDPLLRKRFEREAWAAARVSSDPNTITIYDVGECDGRPFIVMEYLRGGSIEDVLKESGAQPVPRALDWLRQAAAALDHAHTHNVVHRDVKPANLLLSEDGRVQVADFGVASAAGLDSLTQTGTIIGTAGYLSPEQAEGKRATSASDRYSLGVVGFELLAGRRPFERRDAASEAAAHAHMPVPDISAINAELPPGMDAVFERALAKDPAVRFQTCAEFVAALRAADASGTQATRVITLPPTPTRGRNRIHHPTTRSKPSHSWLVLAGVVALAAGVLAAVLIARAGTDKPRAAPVLRVTVTEKGTTVLQTLTEQPSPPPATTPPATATNTAPTPATAAPSTIALQGYARMRSGDYLGAIPLLEQAATGLKGTHSLDEAYNDYNLAFSLAKTEGCSERVRRLLDASEAIQGHRQPIDDLRKACTQ
jgi:eukaryotic-like serine/threonine-protein kinase